MTGEQDTNSHNGHNVAEEGPPEVVGPGVAMPDSPMQPLAEGGAPAPLAELVTSRLPRASAGVPYEQPEPGWESRMPDWLFFGILDRIIRLFGPRPR